MPQFMWQNNNSYDEWREVSELLKGGLAASGVQTTKSEDAAKTVGDVTWSDLCRRVVKIEDGFYAEFYNLRGGLIKEGIGFSDGLSTSDNRSLSMTAEGVAGGGMTIGNGEGLRVGVATSTLGGVTSLLVGPNTSTPSDTAEYALAKDSYAGRAFRGENPEFGGRLEMYFAAAIQATEGASINGTMNACTATSTWTSPVGTAAHQNIVLGGKTSQVTYPNESYPAVVNAAGSMYQASYTGYSPTFRNGLWELPRANSDSYAKQVYRTLLSTTYLRVAPSVDEDGELVAPTQFVALPLVSSLIVGDGILAATCVPYDGVPGSGCFVVAGKVSPLNPYAEASPLTILRKSPIVWGEATSRNRRFTGHAVGNHAGSQSLATLDMWHGVPPVATDAKLGGIVAAAPYLYASGAASEFRGFCDAVGFCSDSISRGASAWNGNKRYLCVDKGLLLRTI